MSLELGTNARRTLFDDAVKPAYASAGPDLRMSTTFRALTGVQTYTFRTMGRALAEERVVSQSELNLQDIKHDTVPVSLQNWYASELTDLFDQDVTNAPQEIPELAKVLAQAVKRRETQLVIDVLDAVTLPVDHVIPGATEGMTVTKLLRGRELLKANDITEPITMLFAEEQERNLLEEDGNRFTDADFAASSGAQTGDIRQGHFGVSRYQIIGSGRSESGLAKTGLTRNCYMFVPSSVGLAVGFGGGPETRVTFESNKESWRSTVKIRANAAVIDTLGIIRIEADEVV